MSQEATIHLNNSINDPIEPNPTELTLFQRIIEELDGPQQVVVPIDRIDEVTVACTIHKTCRTGFMLNIKAWFDDKTLFGIQFHDGDVFECFLKQTLHTLKYDKMSHLLQRADKQPYAIFEAMKLIPETESIVFDYADCVVCFEPTTLKTNCNHHICLPCETKIRLKAKSENKPKLCPMCRHINYTPFLSYADDMSDDE